MIKINGYDKKSTKFNLIYIFLSVRYQNTYIHGIQPKIVMK